MVAYSFKRRFVDPIRSGIGHYEHINGMIPPPKLQTIRATGKRRHARPGDTLQLYHGMRSRDCFLIGTARCLNVEPIKIMVDSFNFHPYGIDDLEAFARSDGFATSGEMYQFWLEEHGPGMFQGLLIRWEP